MDYRVLSCGLRVIEGAVCGDMVRTSDYVKKQEVVDAVEGSLVSPKNIRKVLFGVGGRELILCKNRPYIKYNCSEDCNIESEQFSITSIIFLAQSFTPVLVLNDKNSDAEHYCEFDDYLAWFYSN